MAVIDILEGRLTYYQSILSYNITHLTMINQEEHIVSLERLFNHHKSTSRYNYTDELNR